ncbi:phasin family protein [bacterium]|nr:phasin family protein [bacterium]
MTDLIENVILAGLGLLSLTEKKAKDLAKDLIKRGELSETKEAEFVKDIMKKAEKVDGDIEKRIEKIVEKYLEKLNIPTRKDLDNIEQKLDRLIKEK